MSGQVNRAAQLWKNWAEKQQELEGLLPGGQIAERRMARQQYDFLQKGVYRIGDSATPGEKMVLELLKGHLEKLERQLYPNGFVRALVKVKQFLYDRPLEQRRHERLRQENLATLEYLIGKKGFGSFSGKLEHYLDFERGKVDIPMVSQLGGDKSLEVTLHLEKDDNGRYVMPAFTAGLKDHLAAGNDRAYRFADVSNMRAETVVNLLQGRPVKVHYEAGEDIFRYKWLQLEFKAGLSPKMRSFSNEFGFDPAGRLGQLAEKLGAPSLLRPKVLALLEKGNAVSFQVPGVKERFSLEVNPGAKGVLIRGNLGQAVPADGLLARKRAAQVLHKAKVLEVNRGKNRGKWSGKGPDQSQGIQ